MSRSEQSGRPRRGGKPQGRGTRPGRTGGRPGAHRSRPKKSFKPAYNNTDFIRLNKFIANAGVCSRREADTLIAAGVVAVNGKVVMELGTRISKKDVVKVNGETLRLEQMRYVLLNKPKDFITAMDDPFSRRTVLQLLRNCCKERIAPIGRMDRNSTGLLLFTNDGDLLKILSHPAHKSKKIYHVHTKRPVREEQLTKIREGFLIEDSMVKAEEVSHVDGRLNEVGIEIHSNKNRQVQRIFEALGHEIKKLDRVYFNGLTKKDLPRGRWRHLTEEEVLFLRRSVSNG